MNKNDGGQAFPTSTRPYAEGMSLRDWFAGQALAGWLAGYELDMAMRADDVSRFIYEIADAMLKAREGGGS